MQFSLYELLFVFLNLFNLRLGTYFSERSWQKSEQHNKSNYNKCIVKLVS